MADYQYRGSLKTASIPLLSELFGRSVIVGGQGEQTDSTGVPQVYYAHNVIPNAYGFQSVGYTTHTEQVYPDAAGFLCIHTLRDAAGNSALFSMDSVGNLYVMPAGSSAWTAPLGAPAASTVSGHRITVAFVSGVTYIYFANVGCYTYDFSTNTLSSVTLTGLTAANVLGLVGNSGYMLAYTSDSIAWSAVTDPTLFTPSLITGAGGGRVEDLRGTIVHVQEIFGGMIIFASDNAVAALYNGNAVFPYTFTAVQGCGGTLSACYIAQDTGSGVIYAYTKSGLQAVTPKSATVIFPEVTDFLSGSYFEHFNEGSNELVTEDAGGFTVPKRLTMVSDRYAILSYGIGSATDALYLDVALQRWGRLRIPHSVCFELAQSASAATEFPKKSIAFLTSGGGIKVLDSDILSDNSSGVILIGKLQHTRARMMQLNSVDVENTNQGSTFSLSDLPSLDGKNFQAAVPGYLSENTGKFRRYRFRTTALNHTILCKGSFNLVSYVVEFTNNGDR